jgi:phosphoribosylanthranilate isomerase
VAQAVARTGAKQLDVSSGVERAPGIKDAKLIRSFIENAQGLTDA